MTMHMTRLLHLSCVLAVLLFGGFLPAAAAQPAPLEQLFGYQAFPVPWQEFPLYTEKNWRRVLKAEQQTPCLQRDSSCLQAPDASQWLNLARKAASMDELTLLRNVNAFFNKYPIVPDMENYGKADYWPTLAEFFSRRSGDCKAYTLSKYFALRALGMEDDKLRIVLVFQPARKTNHAVLAVNTAKGVFILDNSVRPIDLILRQEKYGTQCIPLFMLNEKGRWSFRQDEALQRAQ